MKFIRFFNEWINPLFVFKPIAKWLIEENIIKTAWIERITRYINKKLNNG